MAIPDLPSPCGPAGPIRHPGKFCRLALPMILLLAAGCSALLPGTSHQVRSPWATLEGARLRFDQIVTVADKPSRGPPSTGTDLHILGFHPDRSPNVRVLNHLEILERFQLDLTDAFVMQGLDPGLRACIAGGHRCQGYVLTASNIQRQRQGNFFLDYFRFEQETREQGWSYNALVLVRDGVVMFKQWDGQPVIDNLVVKKTPLGPFQNLIHVLRRKVFDWGGVL
ncbi:MAG: hypothetical protein HQL82_01375 [Magnetococcales bacterium]|nr:hypothetical protein [Magnetococcales bacterium]